MKVSSLKSTEISNPNIIKHLLHEMNPTGSDNTGATLLFNLVFIGQFGLNSKHKELINTLKRDLAVGFHLQDGLLCDATSFFASSGTAQLRKDFYMQYIQVADMT